MDEQLYEQLDEQLDKQLDVPYLILGKKYFPDDMKVISNNRNLLPTSDSIYDWSYRDPGYNVSVARGDPQVKAWHNDFVTGSTKFVVSWSNAYPTEILLPNGNIVAGEPNDIVLINNRLVRHRIPPYYVDDVRNRREAPRHFIRGYLPETTTWADVRRWRRKLALEAKLAAEAGYY